MAKFLGVCGFGCRSAPRDRIIGPTGTYDTVNLPSNSPSSTSWGNTAGVLARVPWYNDATGTPFSPATGAIWFHGRYRPVTAAQNATTLRFGMGRNGTEWITLSGTATNTGFTLRVAGTVRQTYTANFSLGNFSRVHLNVSGVTAGSVVSLYTNGNLTTPLGTYTLIAGDATALAGVGLPNEFHMATPTADGVARFDDLLAWDPTDVDAPDVQDLGQVGVKEVVFTGNGAEQQWTGNYTDIDERPASDVDKIVANAANDLSTFTKDAIVEPNVYAYLVKVRVTRTDTSAGSNIRLVQIEGASTENGPTFPAPADGDVQHIFSTAPDLSALTPTNFDATRLGPQALT